MNFNKYPEIEPPQEVNEFETINDLGEVKILEWYAGDCFLYKMGGGYWTDRDSEESNEITNVIFWREIQLLNDNSR